MSAASPSHPYYPVDAYIAGYSPNEASVLTLLTAASGGSVVLLGTTLALTSYAKPSLSMADRLAILWFVLCTLVSFLSLLCMNHELTRYSWQPSLFLRGLLYRPP